jgi:hypothetical protein
MKKIFYTLLPLLILSSVTVYAQPPGVNNWTSKDRKDFVSSCIGTASAGMSVDSARHYCICMLDNIESMYPNSSDAAKISSEDLESPAWKKLVQQCLTGQWTSVEREEFISNCVSTAKEHIGEIKATSYCECMLYKVEKAFPDSADADKLTEKLLATPEWQKKLKECLANAQ